MKKNRSRFACATAALAAFLMIGAKTAPRAVDFPFRFYRSVAKTQDGKNFIFSPHSVSQAFLLADLGANGATRSQIEQTIDLKSSIAQPTQGDNAPALWIANRAWLGQGVQIEKSYLDATAKEAGAQPGTVDFAGDPAGAAKMINSWVSDQTHGRIENLIPPDALNARTRLVLTNAVYFKGPWETPFKPQLTSDANFTLSSGQKLKVPFMHEQEHFNVARNGLVQLIELPYFGREFAMVILLPNRGVPLSKVEASFSAAGLEKLESGMTSAQTRLSLPRFKFTSDFVLNDALRSVGVRLAFEPGRADFSGIDGMKDLYVSKVFHKAFISVDEAGTEAAAATAIEMRMKAVLRAEKPLVVNVDHPFLFVIQDLRSRDILFAGRVTDPR